MAQDIWKLFGVVVPIGPGGFVIILVNKVLFLTVTVVSSESRYQNWFFATLLQADF